MKIPIYGPRLRKVARQCFGWPSLRPGQFKPMRAVLRRRDALVVLPTGAGKSAIYQIPAVLLPGPTVVISPLLALQQDQIAALSERNDPRVRAVRVSSAETPNQQRGRSGSCAKAGPSSCSSPPSSSATRTGWPR